MNIDLIRPLILAKSGSLPVEYEASALGDFAHFLSQADIFDYLTRCLPTKGYVASGVRVHNLVSIRDEVCEGAGPGGYIFPHGYVVVASSIGGNAICLHSPSGRVVWANHEGFAEGTVCYKDRESGEWKEAGLMAASIERAVVVLSPAVEGFLSDLLSDRLQEPLYRLEME